MISATGISSSSSLQPRSSFFFFSRENYINVASIRIYPYQDKVSHFSKLTNAHILNVWKCSRSESWRKRKNKSKKSSEELSPSTVTEAGKRPLPWTAQARLGWNWSPSSQSYFATGFHTNRILPLHKSLPAATYRPIYFSSLYCNKHAWISLNYHS